jgi:hypothetical protein
MPYGEAGHMFIVMGWFDAGHVFLVMGWFDTGHVFPVMGLVWCMSRVPCDGL